jgi:molybdopterin molybdotransferase
MSAMSRPLVDDCFVSNKPNIGHDEAIRQLREHVTGIASTETVLVAEAAGRVVAESVEARSPVPAHTNSAVDGYAFAAGTLPVAPAGSTPAVYGIVGRAAAGHPFSGKLLPGSAVRIFTGAVVPDACDTVAMQEDCPLSGPPHAPRVEIPAGLKRGANVRKAGEDVATGHVLFKPGHILRPQDLGALASIGRTEVACYRRLRIGLVSSGDEVLRAVPGQAAALKPGQVFDANGPMLASLATLAGGTFEDLGVWPDDVAEIESRLRAAAPRFDLILTSGGASRGDEDHMGTAIDRVGRRHIWQLAIKPGRPIMFGQLKNAGGVHETVVVGLPGNPVAVFVCFLMYVYPLVRALGGAPWPEPRRFQLPAAFAFAGRKPGRREFWRGMLIAGPDGRMSADKFARDGSGLISSLRAADGLIDIPEARGDIAVGDTVAFIPFTEFGIL